MIVNTNKELAKFMAPIIANNKKITLLDQYKDQVQGYYNCWGFVARVFHWIDRLDWVGEYQMDKYLAENTRWVKKPKIGDIAVWRINYHELNHTALIVDPEHRIILQKCGGNALEYGQLDDLTFYDGKITFRRVKQS